LDEYEGDNVHFEIISSEANDIVDTLMEVVKTLVIGVFLTMLVLFIFFGDVKACLIVAVSMPLSVLMALILLGFKGVAFDLMSGTALVIAIGMIVDNSIVVLESCFRANEQGLDFQEAAVQGTSQVLMSVFAGTLTTIVVYIPLAMASGLSGQMAGPLSWTIALVMISSLICAVTVVPLIFAFVKPTAKKELPVNRILSALRVFYRKVMPGLLRHPWRVLVAAIAIFAFSIALLTQMEFVLFPSNYDGSIVVNASFRAGTQLEVMDQRARELEQALLDDPYFQDVTVSISGESAVLTAYSVDNCPRSSEKAVEEYVKRFDQLPGLDVTVDGLNKASGFASLAATGNTVEITLTAEDLDSLQNGATAVEHMMAQVPGVLHIENPFNQSRVQGRLVIDPQKAMAAGMSQSAAAAQISYMLNGLTAATIDYGDKEYDVVLEYPEGKYDDISTLMNQPIDTGRGTWVTMGDIATIEYDTTLPSISRQDGKFIVTITATTTASAKSDASKAINAGFKTLELPDGVTQGQTMIDTMTEDETSQMGGTIATALFLVFLVMALQFNSPKLSLMVMLCIPFSLAGSFGFMFVTTGSISLLDLFGFLVLFGIVVNNGILLIDATHELRKTMPLGDALIQAGETRLRPILMTTMTTVISMIPLILSTDGGMSSVKGMGYVVIGGLVASTILTMFLMPPFYLLIRGESVDGTKRGRGKRKSMTADS
jgi:HAE1 family hydrophobic/amphiphilic exporter-1